MEHLENPRRYQSQVRARFLAYRHHASPRQLVVPRKEPQASHQSEPSLSVAKAYPTSAQFGVQRRGATEVRTYSAPQALSVQQAIRRTVLWGHYTPPGRTWATRGEQPPAVSQTHW